MNNIIKMAILAFCFLPIQNQLSANTLFAIDALEKLDQTHPTTIKKTENVKSGLLHPGYDPKNPKNQYGPLPSPDQNKSKAPNKFTPNPGPAPMVPPRKDLGQTKWKAPSPQPGQKATPGTPKVIYGKAPALNNQSGTPAKPKIQYSGLPNTPNGNAPQQSIGQQRAAGNAAVKGDLRKAMNNSGAPVKSPAMGNIPVAPKGQVKVPGQVSSAPRTNGNDPNRYMGKIPAAPKGQVKAPGQAGGAPRTNGNDPSRYMGKIPKATGAQGAVKPKANPGAPAYKPIMAKPQQVPGANKPRPSNQNPVVKKKPQSRPLPKKPAPKRGRGN